MYSFSKLEAIYPVKTKIEIKASILAQKENKGEKRVNWMEKAKLLIYDY